MKSSLLALLFVFSTFTGYAAKTIELLYLPRLTTDFEVESYYDIKRYHASMNSRDSVITLEMTTADRETLALNLTNCWGYRVTDEKSNETQTFRVISGKVYELKAGNPNEPAIYYRNFSMYLIYAFIYNETYLLDYEDKFIKLRSKKYVMGKLEDECLKEKLVKSNRSMGYFITTDNAMGENRLLSLIDDCAVQQSK